MRASLLLLLGMSFARIATAGVAPSEFFDERTGATVTVAHDALVFPMDSPFRSTFERPDYVSLTAVRSIVAERFNATLWPSIGRPVTG